MARVETIIVGGGIAAVPSFTLGAIPRIVSVDPPAMSDSILRQSAGAIIVGASDVAGAAPTETFRTIDGIISECVIVGVGAGSNADSARLGRANTITGVGASLTFTGGNVLIGGLARVVASGGGNPNVVIGYNASMLTSGTGNAHGGVIIGANASCSTASGSGAVVIGVSASQTGNHGVVIGSTASAAGRSVTIGVGATTSGTSSTITIGESSSNSSANTVCIGVSASIGSTSTSCLAVGDNAGIGSNSTRSIALGSSAVVTGGHTNAIVIGSNIAASGGSNTCIIGSGSTSNITTYILGGNASTSTVALLGDVLIRLTNAVTTANLTAGNLTLQPGLGTGNATQPGIRLAVGDAVAGSSSTLATAFNAIAISNNTTDITTQHDSAVASTKNVRTVWATAGTQRMMIGAAGAANGIVTGSAAGEGVIRMQTQRLLFSMDSGATVHADFTAAGILELNVNRGLAFTNATSSAAAQAGTLGNAPAAGNPTFWLKVSINGGTFAIPCWAG